MRSRLAPLVAIAFGLSLCCASCDNPSNFSGTTVSTADIPCAHRPGGHQCNTCPADDAGTSACSGVIPLADPRLEAAVRNALGIPTDPILATDAELLIDLTVQNDVVPRPDQTALSLEGIGCLTNLTEIAITMSVADLAPLASLPCLDNLSLTMGAHSDLSALPTFPGLAILVLRHDEIVDISAISKLTSLARLDLSNNVIADISALAGATIPNILDLRNNVISDLSPLAANKKISAGTQVALQGNPIDCAGQKRNIQTLRQAQITVTTDCP